MKIHHYSLSLLIPILTLSAQAADVTWIGGTGNWATATNWDNGTGPAAADWVFIQNETDTVNYNLDSTVNYRGINQTDGTFNFSGGELRANSQSNAISSLDGTFVHTDGIFDVNAARIGSSTAASNASYTLSGGELTIGRARNNVSLYLGAHDSGTDAGNGTFTISGGQFQTRNGVKLGDDTSTGIGHFAVLGANASAISIAGSNNDTDGHWTQYSGSTLEIGISEAGVTPIIIVDSETSTVGTSVTFASGSLLDVDYHNITSGGGSWVVMVQEDGDIVDEGLAFAPDVDTSIWSFEIDNTGADGRLIVSATGTTNLGHNITIGNTQQQKMRYGMDYERLWFWTSSLNGSERDQIARWSAVDTDIDFIRVAMNSGYELTEGTYNLSAYTNKIIPLMQEMREANPNLKYFASPRPLNEAVSGVAWQPYPQWVTGSTGNNSDFDFDPQKCAEYIERYILLMKDYGFQISFLDMTNEWQTNAFAGSRITTGDVRDIVEYLDDNLPTEDVPLIVAPSAWNYSQGGGWMDQVTTTARRDAIDIAACHNTDRGGNAANFAARAKNALGDDAEIWNTEVHGWKSTSSENETTSFKYYLEAVRAGFGGLNGWLAIGTTNQGHSYILNPSGTPTRNVKYYIFQKFSSTSNYGYAMDILEEPESLLLNAAEDYDAGNPRNIAAFIKDDLMTVWVINENATPVPVNINPSGYNIATSTVRRTHWVDPSNVEGFELILPVTGDSTVQSTIPAYSVCCFEIPLDTTDFSAKRFEGEDFSHQWGIGTQSTGDIDGGENVSNINGGDFVRFGAVALEDNSRVAFRVARANNRPDGFIVIREGHSEGPIVGQVSIPETGNWQAYQTIETELDINAGIYNLYLEFVEDGDTGGFLANLNWFAVNNPDISEQEIKDFEVITNEDGDQVVNLSVAESIIGQNYQVMTSDSMLTNTWTPLGDPISGTGGSLQFTMTLDAILSASDKRFFRIEIAP